MGVPGNFCRAPRAQPRYRSQHPQVIWDVIRAIRAGRRRSVCTRYDRGSFPAGLAVAAATRSVGAVTPRALKIWFGSPGRIRTSDQPVNSRLLYH